MTEILTEQQLPDEAPEVEEQEDEKAPRLYPAVISEFLSHIIPFENLVAVVGAGDGSLLDSERFNPDYCIGMESEEKHSRRRQGTYTALVGDFDKALTLLEPLDFAFPHTIIDLTRGLPQSIVAEVQGRQPDRRVTVVVQPSDHQPLNTAGLVASVTIPELELTFRFLLRSDDRKVEFTPVERTATLDTLDLLGPWVQGHLDEAVGHYYKKVEDQHARYDRYTVEEWRLVHKEYGRRFVRDAETRAFDIQLVGGKLMNVHIGGWATKVLTRRDHYSALSNLHNKTVNTFGQNPGAFDLMMEQATEGILYLDPRLVEVAEEVVRQARFTTSPLYELPVPMRTAFVQEANQLVCIKSDKKRGFERGETYSFRAFEPSPIERHFYKYVEDRKTGDVVLREHKRQIRYLAIRIGNETFQDIKTEDLIYLIRHFRLPNPGSLATRYPDQVEEALALVQTVEETHLTPRGFNLREFQRRDIAMHLAKGSGVLAWEQGLGKTLGGLIFMLASFLKPGTQQAGLIITAQDLMLQWKSEAKMFLNLDLKQIGGTVASAKQKDGARKNLGPYRDIVNAREIAQRLRDPDEGGIYITYYEALSQTGRDLRTREEPFVVKTETRVRWVSGDWQTYTDENGNVQRRYVDGHNEEYEQELWSTEICPRCHNHWDGNFCKQRLYHERPDGRREKSRAICGYSVWGSRDEETPSGRAPTIGHLLAGAFKRGVIVVDEGTMIGGSANGNDSQRSLAVRGLKARYRLLMTGTPVKNFISQAFWLLWWTLGNKSKRFDYGYGDRSRFADTFTVFQWVKNDEGQWGPKKAVGEVTNLSRLWRQFASSMTRRTQDNCGEDTQPVKFHVIETPLGIHQREQIEFMRVNSGELFVEKGRQLDPPVRRSPNGLGALGFLDTKWNYACVMPQADPDWEWSHVPVSNWTPMTLKTLETVMALVKQGRKVLLGTDLVASVTLLSDALQQKGIHAFPLVDASGKTVEPKKRAKLIQEFKEGDAQVLVSTSAAMKLGHSLQAASAVVLHGLPWDYETFYQYVFRVRRLNSERPIDVFVVLPGQKDHTIIGRKWSSLEDKAKGIGKALDGVLTEREEEEPDINEILRELREKGVPVVGNEVEERDVEKSWRNTPLLHAFEIPQDFLDKLAADKQAEHDWSLCPDCGRPVATHSYWGEIPLCDETALLLRETEDNTLDPSTRLYWEAIATEYEVNSQLGIPDWMHRKLAEFDGPSQEELAAAEAVGDFLHKAYVAIKDFEAGAAVAEVVGEFLSALDPTKHEPITEASEEPIQPEAEPIVTAVTDITTIRAELLQYKELYDANVLTDEEFAEIKAALIGQLKAATTPAAKTTAASGATEQLSLIA